MSERMDEPAPDSEVLDDDVEDVEILERTEFLEENPEVIPEMGESAVELSGLEDDDEIIEGNGKEEIAEGEASEGAAGSSSEVSPLVAVNLDLKKDAADAAHDIAEKMFLMKKEERSGKKGFAAVCKSVWGNFTDSRFREAKIRHYEKKAYEMILEKQAGGDNELKDSDWSVNTSGIERFVQAYVNGFEEEMIHRSAGEEMNVYGVETDDDGSQTVYRYNKELENGKEALNPEDPEAVATIGMREAISEYAKGEMNREGFEEEIKHIKQNLAGKNEADLMIDNYVALAEAAKERVTHEEKIENVMEGFRLINGEARRNVRSEAHRNALDKITGKLVNNPLGRLIPPEAIGVTVGLATSVLQTTARTTARALLPGIGGAAVAGNLAALKEANRVAWDRQDLARRMARGESAGDTEYDKQMLDTMYEMKPANEYTEDLNEKMKAAKDELSPESLGDLLEALAKAETAVKLGDSAKRGVDLISYSSGDTAVIEKERLALDVARAQAKSLLGRDRLKHSVAFAKALEMANETFEEDIDAKDKLYKKLRLRRGATQAGKAALATGVTAFAGQEIVAALSPDKYGVFDDVFHLSNNADAENTVLARAGAALGLMRDNSKMVKVEEIMGVSMTEEQAERMREAGYSVYKNVENTYNVFKFERQSPEETMATLGIPLTGKRKELTLGKQEGDGRGGPSVTEGAYTDEARADMRSTIQGAGRGGAEYYSRNGEMESGTSPEQPSSPEQDTSTEQNTSMEQDDEPQPGSEVLYDVDEVADEIMDKFLDWDWDAEVNKKKLYRIDQTTQVAAEHLLQLNNLKSRYRSMYKRNKISREEYDAAFDALEKIRIADREELKKRLAQSQAKTPEDMEKPVKTVTVDEDGNRVESTIPLVDRFINMSYEALLKEQENNQ